MGCFSVGIRLILVTALTFAWFNHGNVKAAEVWDDPRLNKAGHPRQDNHVSVLAYRILSEIYWNRHEEYIKTLLEIPKTAPLDPFEANMGEGFLKIFSSADAARNYMIDFVLDQVNMQTIAIGVHEKANIVVVAGNVKKVNFYEIKASAKRIFYVQVSEVGLEDSDYPVIREVMEKEYPGFELHVIQPEFTKQGNEVATSSTERQERAQLYHAEIQIQEYFKRELQDFSLEDLQIVPSKQYCEMCKESIVDSGRVPLEGKHFKNSPKDPTDPKPSKGLWRRPDDNENFPFDKIQFQLPPRDPTTSQDERAAAAQRLQGAGGSCEPSTSCASLESINEIDADEFDNKITQLPEGERKLLLSDLDDAGLDKLKGNTETESKVQNKWKQWKQKMVKKLLTAVKEKKTLHGNLRGEEGSINLDKTAISPSILAESVHNLQETELGSIAEEHESYMNGELDGRKSFRVREFSQKLIHGVNMALLGKNFIEGVLNGDPVSLLEMGGIFAADRALSKVGEMMAVKGLDLVESGSKVMGTTMKVAGPIVGSATLGLNIWSLVRHVNDVESLDKLCGEHNNTNLYNGMKTDCKFDHDIAVANVVSEGVGIVVGVASVVEAVLANLSVETGPAGVIFAALGVLLAVATQIFTAVATVAKINSLIVGGLTGEEKLETGWKSFWGAGPPPDIQHLLDIKQGYNSDVQRATLMLKNLTKFQTYVMPTSHTRNQIKYDCKCEFDWLQATRYVDCLMFPSKLSKCSFKPEIEDDSTVNFKEEQQVYRFRVEPDDPDWGRLECKPNAAINNGDNTDPPHVAGRITARLCHNVIALTAPDRPKLPVLVDLKGGVDSFIGLSDREHVFMVEGASKYYVGGSLNDSFVVTSFKTEGKLDGGGGVNTLVLQFNDTTGADSYRLHMDDCSSSNTMCSLNIQHIIGRQDQAEIIHASCSTEYVDLKGGESLLRPDQILLYLDGCSDKTTTVLKLRQFTHANFYSSADPWTIEFNHIVEFGPGISVAFSGKNNTANQFVFSNDVVFADWSSWSSGLLIKNENKGQEFKLDIQDFTIKELNLTLMTKAGLLINYDPGTESFSGVGFISKGQKEQFMGLVNLPNYFTLLTSDAVNVTGGDKADHFSFQALHKPSGFIDGGGGDDAIIVHDNFHPDQVVYVNFQNRLLYPCDRHGALPVDSSDLLYYYDTVPCDSPQALKKYLSLVQFSNFEYVIGRHKLEDQVTVDCGVKWIDLKGGKSSYWGDDSVDVIRIPSEPNCWSDMTITVGEHTRVENDAMNGTFHYQITGWTLSRVQVRMNKSNSIHNYIFNQSSNTISELTFDNDSQQFQIRSEKGLWMGTIPSQRSNIYLSDHVSVQLVPKVRGIVQVQSDSVVKIIGLQICPNSFILGAVAQGSTCTGGGKDDIFYIKSEMFRGQVFGGNGVNNAIVLDSQLWNGQAVFIDGINQTISVMEKERKIPFIDIQGFVGREGQPDVVVPGCNTSLIDTRGGSNDSLYDLINVSPHLDCFIELNVAIRPNLVVFNDAPMGNFVYEGDFRGGQTSIFLTFSHAAEHKIILDMEFLELERLEIFQNRLNITSRDSSQFSVDIYIPHGEQTHTKPLIFFKDGLQLKVSQNGGYSSAVYGVLPKRYEESDQLRALIEKYRKTATITKTSVVMEVAQNRLVSIGSGGRFDVLTAVPGYEQNDLICNGAMETVYRIAKGALDVHIIPYPKSNGHHLLDFTQFFKHDPDGRPDVRPEADGALFSIENLEVFVWDLMDKDVQDVDNWKVLLRETYLRIVLQNDHIDMLPDPVKINPQLHNTVVVNSATLERDARINMFINTTYPTLYEPYRENNTLVMTNLFQKDLNVATVVFHDFFNPKLAQGLIRKRVQFTFSNGNYGILRPDTLKDSPLFDEQAVPIRSLEMDSTLETKPLKDEL